MAQDITNFIRDLFGTDGPVFLHEPRFRGNEKAYLNETIDSTYVSSVGEFVTRFETDCARTLDMPFGVATMNGTAALHISLLLAGVENQDEVITQPLTFIATCNAISYCGAHPVFVDVDKDTMGLSPTALSAFLEENAEIRNGTCVNKTTNRKIRAVLPMHSFGHACRIDEIAVICEKWSLALVEDAAEALGSRYKEKALGSFGKVAALSFNGNKILTTGGGGMIVTSDEALARRAKHLTTTAKVAHAWDFTHDAVGYNYRMPNLNAALGCAQLEMLDEFLISKRDLAALYREFFHDRDEVFFDEPTDAQSNFWLNAIIMKNLESRDAFLAKTNAAGIMTRPVWTLMNRLDMFKSCQRGPLDAAEWLADRVVNLPSSARV